MPSTPRLNPTEIGILTLLVKTSMHVRALRRELDDNGAVSTHLKHLEELDLVKREKKKGRVVNTLTQKGRYVAKALKLLKLKSG
ncbi:MAG: winged helix-turn-helix domain-containing protein [Nitrososphaerales archaeon]